MALTAPAITAALEASRAAGVFPLLGSTFSQISLAVGVALQGWAIGNPANLALTGSTTGAAGPGVILPPTTRIIVPPNPAPVSAGLASTGVVGPTSTSVATAIASGLSSVFTASAQYSGVSPAVGSGADVSRITVANVATLTPLMVSAFEGIVGPGPTSPQLASGLSLGITNLLLLGTGTGVVTPAPGPPPVPPPVVGVTGPSAVV